MIKAPLAFVFIALPLAALGDYVATGDIEGQECSGFGIKSCSLIRVDAVKGDDGQFYTVMQRYVSVSDYDSSKQRCWIETKTRGGGLLGWFVDGVTGPDFYTETEEGMVSIDVDYITFPCREI